MEQQQQLQEVTTAIDKAYDKFISALNRFTDKQINIAPFEGSWTPGQVAHHIIKATSGVPDQKTEVANRPIDAKVGEIESVFLDFSVKFKSPDFILPDNKIFDKNRLLERLNAIRLTHIENSKRTDLSEVCMDFALPGIGHLTRYEWYRFIAAHCHRHTYQLQEMHS